MVVSGQAPAAPSKEAIAAARIEKVKDNLYVIAGSGAGGESRPFSSSSDRNSAQLADAQVRVLLLPE